MKLPSSSSFQCLAAATTDTTMSSTRAPYRGRNPWRREFSAPPSGGRDPFVSGDSHFRSVSDSNYGFRQGSGGGFHQPPYRQPPPPQYRPQPPPYHQQPPPPNYHQQPPPSNYHHQRPLYYPRQPPPQYFHQPRPFRQPRPFNQPRPKAPDHRNWEYALSQPPSSCERFVVLSYNILAEYLALNHRAELYFHIPRHILDWEWRKRKIVFELGLWSPDIMCLQEVDRFQDLEEELKRHGYSGIWKMRTGVPVDGCAIFWRTTRFKLLHEEHIEFNKLGLRDNVAQICVLESRGQNPAANTSAALPPSSNGANQVVICNIHVLYNPKRGEIKLGQVRVLLDKAYTVSKLWNDAPVVICGDFNCTPKSPLYTFISEQKLDLTGLGRDQISGQSSAELHKAKQYNPNRWNGSPRAQTPDNLLEASIDVGVKESNHMPEKHNHKQENSNLESGSLINNSTQLQSANSLDNKICSDVNDRTSNKIPDAAMEDTQGLVDSCRNDASSNYRVPSESENECSLSCHEEGMLTADLENNAVQGLTPLLTPAEGTSSLKVELGPEDNPSGSTDQYDESLTEHPDTDMCTCSLTVATRQGKLVQNDDDGGSLDLVERVTSFAGEVYYTKSGLDRKTDTLISHNSPDPILDTSPDYEVSLQKCLESCSLDVISRDDTVNPATSDQCIYQLNTSDASTSIDLDDGNKVVESNKPGEVMDEDGSLGQDPRLLSSMVNRTDDVLQFNLDCDSGSVRAVSEKADYNLEDSGTTVHDSQLSPPFGEGHGVSSPSIDFELADLEKNTYGWYSWTPMEIETASGNAEITLLEHPLKLRSTYSEVEDYSGTRDSSKEPEVTSYHRRFMGTVDYIWCSEGLQTVKVLDTIPKRALQWTPGFPTQKWGSDHIALASQLAFTKDVEDRS